MRKPYQSPGSDEKLILLYCPGRDKTHDLLHTVTSNMVKVSPAVNQTDTAAVVRDVCFWKIGRRRCKIISRDGLYSMLTSCMLLFSVGGKRGYLCRRRGPLLEYRVGAGHLSHSTSCHRHHHRSQLASG